MKTSANSLVTDLAREVAGLELREVRDKGEKSRLLLFNKTDGAETKTASVKVKKYLGPDDPRLKKAWSQRLSRAFENLAAVSHPQIAPCEKHSFSASGDLCEILLPPDLSAALPDPSAKHVRELAEQTLAAFSHIESLGLACIGATLKSVRYNPTAGFVLASSVASRLIPRWAVRGGYQLLDRVTEEYAGPELSLYRAKSFVGADGGLGKAFDELLPEIDMSTQDVYGWAIMVLKFLAGNEPMQKGFKDAEESYAAFLKSIGNVEIKEDTNGELGKVLRPILKAALAYDPKARPSFYTLRSALTSFGPTATEEEISLALSNRCKVCGSLSGPKCAFCESATNPSTDPQKLLENLHGVLTFAQTERLPDHTLDPLLARSESLRLAVLANLLIKLAQSQVSDSTEIDKCIDQILAAVKSAKLTDPSYLVQYLADLASALLPREVVALPNFLTIPPRSQRPAKKGPFRDTQGSGYMSCLRAAPRGMWRKRSGRLRRRLWEKIWWRGLL